MSSISTFSTTSTGMFSSKSARFGVFLLVLSVLAPAIAQAEMCYTYYSNMMEKNVWYCIDRTTGDEGAAVPDEPVAYFMHGTNGSHKTWISNRYASALETLRESGQKLPPMTFVSFDTEAYSFFIDHPGRSDKAYETWFMKEFVPFIEANYSVCKVRSCRALLGESMGGFGALKTALRFPESFSSVAVNSPALPAFDIYASMWDWDWFFSHHKIGPVIGTFLIRKVRALMPTEEAWAANDPIELVQNFETAQHPFPAMYFDMGGSDKYGFDVGYENLKAAMDARKLPYASNFGYHIGHCMFKFHAVDAIAFVMNHSANGIVSVNASAAGNPDSENASDESADETPDSGT